MKYPNVKQLNSKNFDRLENVFLESHLVTIAHWAY